jgi:hypothetical protein
MSILGLDAVTAIQRLVGSVPAISSIRVFKYEPPPAAQLRVERTEAEKQLFNKALDLRKIYQLPFWDSLLVSCFSSEEVPHSILIAARLHVSHRASDIEVPRADVLDGVLQRFVAELKPETSLAVVSAVQTQKGTTEHIPLVDFHIPCSDVNQNIVSSILSWLLPDGYILLRSGRSYHAWGTKTLPDSDYPAFLAKAMLYSPIIDRAYLAHQLIEGRSALRISSGYPDKPAPSVISSSILR